MKKQILLLTIILGMLTFSCSSKDDNDVQDSEFHGTWTGTYTGESDNGTWTVTIDSRGKITGTSLSTIWLNSVELNGSISANGTIGTVSNGAEFNGQITGTTGSGIWTNTDSVTNGTWSGSKQ